MCETVIQTPCTVQYAFWCPYFMYWKPHHVGSVTSDATTCLSVNCCVCVCSVMSLPSSPSSFKGALAVVCLSSTSCCCLHMCAKILEMANKTNMDECSFFMCGGEEVHVVT